MSVVTGPWRVRCTARSKRTGNPCGNWAVKGATVCSSHGAGGDPAKHAAKEGRERPTASMKARDRRESLERRLLELGDEAVAAVREVLSSDTAKDFDKLRAAEQVLDRIVGKRIDATTTAHDELDLDREIAEVLGELPDATEDDDEEAG